ncbi:hypothetical protein [Spiroplasma endosymbiont of Zeiraphera isertana]
MLLKSKTFIHPEKHFNFQKNSWWNKKNHQPGLKFDFISFWDLFFLQTEI